MARRSLGEQSLIYLGSGFLESLMSSLVWGAILTRVFDPPTYGGFFQILLLYATAVSLGQLGLSQSLLYFLPRAKDDRERKRWILQTMFFLTAVGALVTVIVYLLRGHLAEAWENQNLLSLAPYYLAFFFFAFPVQLADAVFVATDRVGIAATLKLATPIAFILCTLPCIPAWGGRGVDFLLKGMAVFFGLRFILLALYLIFKLPGGLPVRFDLSAVREQWVYCLPLALVAVGGVSRKVLDKYFVATLYDRSVYAIYQRGAFELPLVDILPYALGFLLIPRFVEFHQQHDRDSLLDLWRESIRGISLIFFPLFFFCFLFAGHIFPLLFTENFSGSAAVFRIYLLLLPFRLVSYQSILKALGQTKPILNAAILALLADIIFLVAFARTGFLGFLGPAAAYVGSEIVNLAYLVRITGREVKTSLRSLFPLSRLIPGFAVAAVAGLVSLPLRGLNQSHAVVLGVAIPVYTIVYFLSMRVLRLWRDEDWEFLRKWFPFGQKQDESDEEDRSGTL